MSDVEQPEEQPQPAEATRTTRATTEADPVKKAEQDLLLSLSKTAHDHHRRKKVKPDDASSGEQLVNPADGDKTATTGTTVDHKPAHSHLCVLQVYYDAVLQSGLSAKPLAALMKLCKLYALYGITQHAGEFIQDGFMSAVQLSHCDQSLLAVLSALRPDAVALVDAFDISDTRLHSSLGRYDGNVYQSLMEFAENSPLNEKQVHDVFEKYVKPTRDVLAAKL